MKDPTKADLAAAVAKLTEENAGLRDLLAAVSEYARSVPEAVYDDRWKQLSRATTVLTGIEVIADPGGTWAWSWGSGQGAARLRELAAKPVGYEVYAAPGKDEPCSPNAAAVLAAAIAAGTRPAGRDPEWAAGHRQVPEVHVHVHVARPPLEVRERVMSIGFKVKPPALPPAPPPVLAGADQVTCRESPPEKGVYCERPAGHEGGHLSESHHKYWPAEGATS